MTESELSRFYAGKRVLVTGGAGFVGSHVVEALVGFGAHVRVPVRKSTRLDYLTAVEREIEVVDADLFNSDQAAATVKDQQVVLHLAAAKGGGIEHSMKHHGSLFCDNMRIATNMIRTQDESGCWKGKHCITGGTFCTASALLVLTVDRVVENVAGEAKIIGPR